MTIDDLQTIAQLWIEDHRLPEPDTLRTTTPGRVELNYSTPCTLPDIGWRDSTDGQCLVHESDVGGVSVSVFALKQAVRGAVVAA